MSKYTMEACPQISYDLIFQSKQGPIFSYHIKKNKKCPKNTFDLSKFKFQNGLKPQTYIFGSPLKPNQIMNRE